MPLPVEVRRRADAWWAEPQGSEPSSRLLKWWIDGRPLPDGFRWATEARVAPAVVLPEERAVTVDQTNRSVIVGDQVILKWHTTALESPHPAPERLRRLTAAGFDAMPAVWFVLEWEHPAGEWAPVVTAVDYIPGATDGWTWCLHEARIALGLAQGAARPFAADLGRVTARMHLALADSPTGPVAGHGDFHVGQVLRDPGGALYVVDFDGNPTVTATERCAHQPAAYDVAGMWLSLENVGHVVRHYAPDLPDADVRRWSDEMQGTFLESYRRVAGSLLDEDLLQPLVEEQIARELAYAAAYLPGWRYVPEAALRRREPSGGS